MAAPIGNQFWKMRSSHGRNPKFRSAKKLWEACTEYFEWVDSNPLIGSELVKFQGEAKLKGVPKMRAMTLTGLWVFLDITYHTWESYKKRKGFLPVITRVEQIIKTQKFEGAAAELLNPNIIARDLGLSDKNKVVTDDGEGGEAPIATSPVFIMPNNGHSSSESAQTTERSAD